MDNESQWYPAFWGGLHVTGPDAQAFLQGQLSHDLRKTPADGYVWSSYSSPKGRVLAVFRVRVIEGGYALLMPPDLIDPIQKRLKMFVLRSKVELDARVPDKSETADSDRRHMIHSGLPVVYAATQDHWVAQMLNLDHLGGIAFDKGCFTGQEVIARLHYLGKLKRRMFQVRGQGDVPAPGSSILNRDGDSQSVGEIVDAVPEGSGFVASAVLQQSVADVDTLSLERDVDDKLLRPLAYTY